MRADNIPHRPDYTNTEPTVDVGPFPQWGSRGKIVAMDPWGHLSPSLFKDLMGQDNSNCSQVPDTCEWLANERCSRHPTHHCHHEGPYEGKRTPPVKIKSGVVIKAQISCQNLRKVSRPGACMFNQSDSRGMQLTRHRVPDGKVCLNEFGELAVTKFAVEPVCALS